MKQYRYLVIGGGMTAAAALNGIREVDAEGSIGLLSTETHPPYARPPLSKKAWRDETVLAKITRKTPADVDFYLGHTAQTLNVAAKQVTDAHGEIYTYEKLLLATGGTPRRLPFGADQIVYFRTLDDFQHLRALAQKHDKFVIIGGGFIGSEIAAALSMQGRAVTMLFPEPGIGQRALPA